MPNFSLDHAISATDSTIDFGFFCGKCEEPLYRWHILLESSEMAEACVPFLREIPLRDVLAQFEESCPDAILELWRRAKVHDYYQHEVPRMAALN